MIYRRIIDVQQYPQELILHDSPAGQVTSGWPDGQLRSATLPHIDFVTDGMAEDDDRFHARYLEPAISYLSNVYAENLGSDQLDLFRMRENSYRLQRQPMCEA